MVKDGFTMIKQKIYSIFFISLIILILAGCGGNSSQTVGTGSVSLAWNAPTTYVDGTPITGLVGFKVYYGIASRVYTHIIDVRNVPSCSINALFPGTYYFAITAYDSFGIESTYSTELSKTIL